MKVNVPGLGDYKPRGDLKGSYVVKVTDYEEKPEWGSVKINYEIIDGPSPEEFRSPLGRTVSDLVSVDETRCNEDWQLERLVDTLGDLAMCFGLNVSKGSIDFDLLVGKEGTVVIYQKKNKKTGDIFPALVYKSA